MAEESISRIESAAAENKARQFEAALLAVDRVAAARILEADDCDTPLVKRIERWVVPAMVRIGEGWEQGRVALSQVYMSGRICEELVDRLLLPQAESREGLPQIAVATLEDYHLLGKRIVSAVVRSSGRPLTDYGRTSVTPLVQRVSEDGVGILLISTLMLPSAHRVAEVRLGLDRLGCRVKIAVGGAPFRFDEQLWRNVGADAMGRCASDVVGIIDRFLGYPE